MSHFGVQTMRYARQTVLVFILCRIIVASPFVSDAGKGRWPHGSSQSRGVVSCADPYRTHISPIAHLSYTIPGLR